jgi:hypothetical protein
MFPGRSLEVPGDRHPREMIMARMRVQNSAYSPLLFLMILDSGSWGLGFLSSA